jgi:hypothetical protein
MTNGSCKHANKRLIKFLPPFLRPPFPPSLSNQKIGNGGSRCHIIQRNAPAYLLRRAGCAALREECGFRVPGLVCWEGYGGVNFVQDNIR